jgi:Phosphodiester glycosidase
MTLAPALLALLGATPDAGTPNWERLADGVELATLVLDPRPSFSDGLLHAVRIDPEKAELRFGLASQEHGPGKTAAAWAAQKGFIVTINAGMFQTDHASNVGRLVDGAHANNGRWHPDYKSVLAFGPKKKGIPAAVFLDLDAPGAKESAQDYQSQVQNLRLLKGGATNVWKPNGRKWSEAAVGLDTQGRVLFLFSRSPMEMHAWNERLKQLPLGLTRAMHVEGGPEASLSIRAPGKKLDLCGSYESFFRDDDGNTEQWALPNVLGVVARPRSP